MNIYKGSIITCDAKNTVAAYLAESNGRIIYVGNELPAELQNQPVTDLGERALMPSFADTHVHFVSHAVLNRCPDLTKARSVAEMAEMLKTYAASCRSRIVLAFGASPHSVEDKRLITRAELDTVSLKKPIMIVKYEGHSCIVNQVMIDRLPAQIKKLRGYNAETGEMKQEAFFAISDFATRSISLVTLLKSMRATVDELAEKGVGMAHTVSGVGFPLDLDVELERIFARGLNSGFQMRVFYQTMDVRKAKRRGFKRVGGCFANALDGSFCSMDAALTEPYEGTDNRGILFYSDEQVKAFCKKASRAGMQIEMHAVGDAAFDQGVRALHAALEDCPRKDHRHGVIHAFLPTEDGLDICVEDGIQLPMQPVFMDWPLDPQWHVISLLGERAQRLCRLKSALDRGIIQSMGSDAPCTRPDPVKWIHNACNHPVPEQSVSVYDALRMATYNGYWTTFDEMERGSLEVGKIADMVVLSQSPYAVPVDRLDGLRVEQLILAGAPYRKRSENLAMLLVRGLFSRKRV
jgi:predicted amidohydrolase YtcJ